LEELEELYSNIIAIEQDMGIKQEELAILGMKRMIALREFAQAYSQLDERFTIEEEDGD